MTIRIETTGASDLSRTLLWLKRHRGGVVRLDGTRRLTLGTPIAGARAVIVAAVLQDDERSGPQLGGVVRALSNRTDSEPVRMVFEGRSPAGLSREEAEATATEVLERISGMVVDDQPLAEVA
jgi:hypothetical protein